MTRAAIVAALVLCATPALAQSRRRPSRPAPTRPAEPAPAPPPAAPAAVERQRPPRETRAARQESTAEAVIDRAARRHTAVTLALGYHLDNGTMRGQDRRSVLVTDETFEFDNDNKLFGALGIVAPLGRRFRAGAEVRYFGNYDYKRERRNEVDSLGHLVELVARGELPLELVPRVHVLLGAQAGVAVLFPGGDFEEEIRLLRNQGAGVWNVPRLGYLVGPRLGGRWLLGDRFAVRADFDALWAQTFLFMTRENVGGVDFEKTRRANVVRYQLALGIEIAL